MGFKSFTLIEVLLSVALIGAIGSFSMVINQFLQQKNDLDISAIQISERIKDAQKRSTGGIEDSSWGVKVAPGQITLYKGADFAARDQAKDETTIIPGTIAILGLDDVIFTRPEGSVVNPGTIVLKINKFEKNISINEQGVVSY